MAAPSSLLVKSFFLLLIINFFSSCLSSPAEISYVEHCSSFVPQSAPTGLPLDTTPVQIITTYVSGGAKILGPEPDPSSSSSSSSSSNSLLHGDFFFSSHNIYHTKTDDTFHLTGGLNIEEGPTFNWVCFDSLSGFWSKSSGKVCMVGSGYSLARRNQGNRRLDLSAVFKLNYPANSNISIGVVSGILESLDAPDSPSHFGTISIIGYAQNNYSYTQIPKARGSCSKVKPTIELLSSKTNGTLDYIRSSLSGPFRLEYGRDCSSVNCSPLSSYQNNLGLLLPTFMHLNHIDPSADGNVHMQLGFSNCHRHDYYNFLIPGKSLVGEGYWDWEKRILCLVACPVLKAKDFLKDSFVGECTIGLSLWFPAVITIKNPIIIFGRIWSIKDERDPGYFSAIPFRSLATNLEAHPDLKYKYTKFESVKSSCRNNQIARWGSETYPDGSSIRDLRFEVTVRIGDGSIMSGYAIPMSFGDTFYGNFLPEMASMNSSVEKNYSLDQSRWNVSYMIGFSPYNSFIGSNAAIDISAEGIYNAATGMLCMVGCRDLSNSLNFSINGKTEDYMDCEITISLQLSPLNVYNELHLEGNFRSTKHLNGTIKSTREKSDPLFFEPLGVLSHTIYQSEAIETISRMDVEITMVLVSITLFCTFTLLQLFYVKKNQDVLSSISITMLLILAFGYIVPLVSNFAALFMRKQSMQNVLLWSGSWLEVNEVIVRAMTMVAFSLLFRLLQLAWAVRSSEEGKRGLWVAEMKTLRLCLPLYFAGALIAWFVHTRSYNADFETTDYISEQKVPVCAYVGLILNGYLLPQIILNIIRNSKDAALAPIFYIGTTAVRAIPHFYNFYRAHQYIPYIRYSYIYANPDEDFYSSAWDIIIPLQGVLYAIIIFLQQRFGGRFFLAMRFRNAGGYETVHVTSL